MKKISFIIEEGKSEIFSLSNEKYVWYSIEFILRFRNFYMELCGAFKEIFFCIFSFMLKEKECFEKTDSRLLFFFLNGLWHYCVEKKDSLARGKHVTISLREIQDERNSFANLIIWIWIFENFTFLLFSSFS